MGVGGVAEHEVDHHAQAELVRPLHQRVEVGKRPEHRVDVAVVRHVVAEVEHRRGDRTATIQIGVDPRLAT